MYVFSVLPGIKYSRYTRYMSTTYDTMYQPACDTLICLLIVSFLFAVRAGQYVGSGSPDGRNREVTIISGSPHIAWLLCICAPETQLRSATTTNTVTSSSPNRRLLPPPCTVVLVCVSMVPGMIDYSRSIYSCPIRSPNQTKATKKKNSD